MAGAIPPRKIALIVGETGVGKSSVTNLLLDQDSAAVGHGVGGGTFHHTLYPCGEYDLVDTVGFNAAEPVDNTVATATLSNLLYLIRSLRDGLSLIVFVIRRGRLTETTRANYNYFVNTFTERRVPVVLVVTHCEVDHPIDNWYLTNRVEMIQGFQMAFVDSVSLTTVAVNTDRVDPELVDVLRRKRAGGKARLWKAIEDAALAEPWRPANLATWLKNVVVAAAVVLGIGLTVAVITSIGPAAIAAGLGTAFMALRNMRFR